MSRWMNVNAANPRLAKVGIITVASRDAGSNPALLSNFAGGTPSGLMQVEYPLNGEMPDYSRPGPPALIYDRRTTEIFDES